MNLATSIPEGFRRVFAEAFRVADIVESLASFDESTPALDVSRFMNDANFDVVGIRKGGHVSGFVSRPILHEGSCGTSARPISDATVLADTAALTAAVKALADSPWAFVTAFGQVSGIVTRDDLLKPPVRMWLFGVVTLIELRYSNMIEWFYPNGDWQGHLSPGRLLKAEQLRDERRRRGQNVSLLDCLQLADKGRIVARDDRLRRMTIYPSKSQAENGIKMMESLRNSLAHAQDIVACDWDAIVRLSAQIDRLLKGEDTLPTLEGKDPREIAT